MSCADSSTPSYDRRMKESKSCSSPGHTCASKGCALVEAQDTSSQVPYLEVASIKSLSGTTCGHIQHWEHCSTPFPLPPPNTPIDQHGTALPSNCKAYSEAVRSCQDTAAAAAGNGETPLAIEAVLPSQPPRACSRLANGVQPWFRQLRLLFTFQYLPQPFLAPIRVRPRGNRGKKIKAHG